MKYLFFLFSLLWITLFSTTYSYAQKGITTFGLQYKPIIPNRIIGMYEQDFSLNEFESSVRQSFGGAYGMIIRQGLTEKISFETGLGFIQRNYKLSFAVPDSFLTQKGKVSFIGYEIPLKGLIYTRLGKQLYMNTAIGASLNFYPSDIHVNFPLESKNYFLQEGIRKGFAKASLLTNIGLEYRTKKKGYYYIGASYTLPFSAISTFAMSYEHPPGKTVVRNNINGSFLTLDFRYYFHENKDEKKKKKKK